MMFEIAWNINLIYHIHFFKDFDRQIKNLIGDTLVAAGFLAYLGAFTSEYREELLTVWLKGCEEQGIETTANFSLISILAEPYTIRIWNSFGLPRDQVSTENAVLVTQAERWPLMIDPQEQVLLLFISMNIYIYIYIFFFNFLRLFVGYEIWNSKIS